MSTGSRASSVRRAVARKLAVQALYQWQLNQGPWQDIVNEFATAEDMPKADAAYFSALVSSVSNDIEALDAELARHADRSPASLDPVEHAILLIGCHELRSCPEVPFRVAINEAVGLARRFGATDGYKFVNAVLDRAARSLREPEH